MTGGVATKADPVDTEQRLQGEMAEIRNEMAEIRTDLRWMKAIGGVIVALLIGILWVLLDTGG